MRPSAPDLTAQPPPVAAGAEVERAAPVVRTAGLDPAPVAPAALRPLDEVVAGAVAGRYAGPGPDATISRMELQLSADGAELSGSATFVSAAMPIRVTERLEGRADADGTLRLRGVEVRAEGPDGFVGAPQGAHRYELRREGGAIGGVLRNAEGEVYTVRLARRGGAKE